MREQAEYIKQGENIVESDASFHGLLAKAAKNRVMERLLLALVDLLEQTREKYLQDDERAKKSLQGHQRILSAIKNGDCAAARKSMLRHLEDVEGILFHKKRGGGECAE